MKSTEQNKVIFSDEVSHLRVHFIWKYEVILLLTTRCHYWGVHLIWWYTSSEKMTSFCSVHFIWKDYLIMLLAIRCHYWGVHLIWGYTSSAKMTSFCSVHFVWKDDLILLLDTRCHYFGGTSYLSVHFIWKYELISGLGLAPQRSFLQKTNKYNYKKIFGICNTLLGRNQELPLLMQLQ